MYDSTIVLEFFRSQLILVYILRYKRIILNIYKIKKIK